MAHFSPTQYFVVYQYFYARCVTMLKAPAEMADGVAEDTEYGRECDAEGILYRPTLKYHWPTSGAAPKMPTPTGLASCIRFFCTIRYLF